LDKKVLKKYTIGLDEAFKVVDAYLEASIYTEIYSIDDYYIQKSQQTELTKTHAHVLQRNPQIVDSLSSRITRSPIVKIMPVAKDEADKERLTELFKPFEEHLTLSWAVHPIALPHQFGIITAKGISKQQAAWEIANYEGVKKEELLGIGDSTSDWQFMEHCGYVGTMENGSSKLKELVVTKGKGANGFIGGHVDENGVLAIFDYFNL
jgi:hydroxymethylpyrimidine pyrophosphatase-like HAD family hydrolase